MKLAPETNQSKTHEAALLKLEKSAGFRFLLITQ